MYSSFCILLRLRSCSAGTPAGVFAFWGPPSPRRAVVEEPLVPVALGSPAVGYELLAWPPNGPVPQRTDCRLRRKFFRCNVYKKEGGTPLCRSCRSPRPRGLRLSAVGCDLSAWQPNRPVPQRTGRHLRRKFFSCNAYKNVGGGADRADDQAHSNKITPWQWPPRHAGTPTTIVLSIVYFITRGHQGWGVQHQKIPPAVVVTLDELQGFATGQEKPLARPRQCHSERSEESAFRK
jgi:hypothetical protein